MTQQQFIKTGYLCTTVEDCAELLGKRLNIEPELIQNELNHEDCNKLHAWRTMGQTGTQTVKDEKEEHDG